MKPLLALLLLLPVCAAARPVSLTEAATAAVTWAKQNTRLGDYSGTPVVSAVPAGTDSPLYYQANFPSGGTLILSPDTRITPVLAAIPYVKKGKISARHPFRKFVHSDAESRLDHLKTSDPDAQDEQAAVSKRWEKLLAGTVTEEKPALFVYDSTRWERELNHWNQQSFNRYGTWKDGELYDRYTPNHWYAGCVAIAGSAIQQFYRFPKTIPEWKNGFCAIYAPKATRPTMTEMPTRAGDYDWDTLPKTWTDGIELTEAQKELIGRIAYNSGVLTGTHYAAHGSGGSSYFLANNLRKVAGFPTGMEYCPPPGGGLPPGKFLSALLYSQLRCGAPCILDMGSKTYNHATVANGIAEDQSGTIFTHIFFGWGGEADVWYSLPVNGSYATLLGVVTFLSTDGNFLPIYGTVTHPDGTPAGGIQVQIGDRTTVTDAAGNYALRIALPKMPQHTVTVQAGDRTPEADATGNYTLRVTLPDAPQHTVTIRIGDRKRDLTLRADRLLDATREEWALFMRKERNPKSLLVQELLPLLPGPVSLTLSGNP